MKEYFLEELLQIKNGRDHKHLPDGEIPIYGSGGIMRYGNQSIYNEESILLPRKGTLSNIQFVNEPFWTVDTIYYSIVNKEKANPLYLYHYLKQLDLSYLNSGTGVPSMTFGAYYGVKVNLPSLHIQQKIAKVLSDLDAKIELNNKINNELEAMAKTLYDYWFVQFDFPDADGKPYKTSGGKMVWNEELKREIPEGWEVKELKRIAKNIMGQSPKGESYNKEGIGTPLLNGPADYENSSLLGRTYTTEPTRLCKKDDMVLCIRATIGNLTYAEKEFCLGRGVAAVRPNEKRLSEYLFYCLIQEIERFKRQATGSIIVGITKDDLTDSKCLIPNGNLIDKFHEIANPIFTKQRINKIENLKLSSLRDWLLPMLMNGQVRVGNNTEYKQEDDILRMAAEPNAHYKK
ncbi:restriction endonuclease subunit S [Flavobacterium sp.]|uniref:restriction endonuclease subunit S n=1 Tax=Flavobacterium sp. TaxID=239 RepID=UPI002487FD08|nr:restriction endonuclease subunit S [Flavobacterium sp.]MDI1318096.1 restriction endonuclease subunit S [Flavobacterium sp.]